jgi:hypothetical protein
MPPKSDKQERIHSMTGGGYDVGMIDDEALAHLTETRRLIDALGGPVAAAAAIDMDRRTMQRIYNGKRHCSPTLRRRLAEAGEGDHGKA